MQATEIQLLCSLQMLTLMIHPDSLKIPKSVTVHFNIYFPLISFFTVSALFPFVNLHNLLFPHLQLVIEDPLTYLSLSKLPCPNPCTHLQPLTPSAPIRASLIGLFWSHALLLSWKNWSIDELIINVSWFKNSLILALDPEFNKL